MLEIINFQISVKCAKSVYIVEAKLEGWGSKPFAYTLAMALQILGGELGRTTKMFLAYITRFYDELVGKIAKI